MHHASQYGFLPPCAGGLPSKSKPRCHCRRGWTAGQSFADYMCRLMAFHVPPFTSLLSYCSQRLTPTTMSSPCRTELHLEVHRAQCHTGKLAIATASSLHVIRCGALYSTISSLHKSDRNECPRISAPPQMLRGSSGVAQAGLWCTVSSREPRCWTDAGSVPDGNWSDPSLRFLQRRLAHNRWQCGIISDKR